MIGLIITYIILTLMAAVYVGINVFHILKFRLKDPADKSIIALFVYLGAVVTVFSFSLVIAIITYNS